MAVSCRQAGNIDDENTRKNDIRQRVIINSKRRKIIKSFFIITYGQQVMVSTKNEVTSHKAVIRLNIPR